MARGRKPKDYNPTFFPIGNNWRVQADPNNIVLMKRDGVKWNSEGYFSEMKFALSFLVEKEVRATDLTDLKTICARIAELKTMIKGLDFTVRPTGAADDDDAG